ncbi:MAG: DUF4856 domain-containing protein [Gammaproteobacteria bacterium]|nr:DUF4856 domain-containing protein [Gammaproteobacteria bacterium]
MKTTLKSSLAFGLAVLLSACGGNGDDDAGTLGGNGDSDGGGDSDTAAARSYMFESRFSEGASSVAYAGQTFRHLLIADLTTYMESLVEGQDGFGNPASDPQTILDNLNFYYRFTSAGENAPYLLDTMPEATPGTTYGMVNSATTLSEKIAGNDNPLRRGELKGWTTDLATLTPEGLIDYWFSLIAENTTDNNAATDPTLTTEGQDLRQLVQKFLLGAVTYSQGAEDYLNSEAGLKAQNVRPDEGNEPFTTLEHEWDEGFGYYGAARDFNDLTDEQIADDIAVDTDGSGTIDLYSEYNWGHSQNSAKRDLGSSPAASTDFTKGAFDAFLAGRAIITEAGGALNAAEFIALEAQRDIALENWEKSIAATVVHYVNDTLKAMDDPAYDVNAGMTDNLVALAEVWSELKGFSPQFSPYALLSDADFDRLHELLGDAPVLADGTQNGAAYTAPGCACGSPAEQIEGYRDALREGRAIVAAAYAFDPANVGDENGENGW